VAAGWDSAGVSVAKGFSGIAGDAMTKRRRLNNDEAG